MSLDNQYPNNSFSGRLFRLKTDVNLKKTYANRVESCVGFCSDINQFPFAISLKF